MSNIAALIAGTLFGLGLVISGMTDPANVLAFLTLGASWNPNLAVVMASALAVAAVGYALAGRRQAPLWSTTFHLPTNRQIDARLLAGAGLFGLGWGFSGYCPGPALVGAIALDGRALLFMLAFVVGAVLFELFDRNAQPATVDG